MTNEIMVSVRATDLLMVLRHVPEWLTGADLAAFERLQQAANDAAADT